MTSALMPRRVPVAEIPGMLDALRGTGIMTPDEAMRLAVIERSTYCLVRIDDIGERWRCAECNGKHAHFTKLCIPCPVRGVREGLRAYWQNTAVPDRDLSPIQRVRRRRIGSMLGFQDALPSLAEHHPETARALATASNSTDIGAWVIGVIDPISPAKARQLASAINVKARRQIVRL